MIQKAMTNSWLFLVPTTIFSKPEFLKRNK